MSTHVTDAVSKRIAAETAQVRTNLMYIDGRWVEGESGEFAEAVNPGTERVVSRSPVATVKDLHQGIDAARRAFDEGPWPRMTMRERSEVIRRWAAELDKRREELEALVAIETGAVRTPFSGVRGAIGFIEDTADIALKYPMFENLFTGDTPAMPWLPLGGGIVVKEPVGVVGAITPYNAPILITPWKLGPALALGNTVVLKPSPFTPTQSVVFVEALEAAGLPPGVVNLVFEGPGVSQELTEHPAVDLISFTGSDVVGQKVMAQSASTLKRLVMELGGKSPNIVFADADLDRVVPNTLQFLTIAGQGCSLQTRILVQRDVHDELVARIVDALAAVKVGDPVDAGVGMGPLISPAQRTRVESYVTSGIEDGGRVAFGGARPADLERGFFHDPTLMVLVDNRSRIAQDEIFGPVAVVIPFTDEDEAVRIANDSRFGLGGGVHSADVRKAWRVANRLRTGTVAINGGGAVTRAMGGYKASGFGREHGKWGFDEYAELKSITWRIE